MLVDSIELLTSAVQDDRCRQTTARSRHLPSQFDHEQQLENIPNETFNNEQNDSIRNIMVKY
jgi:hypothetical protein